MSTVLDFRKRTAKTGPAAESLHAAGKFTIAKLAPDFRIVFIDTLMVSQPAGTGLHHTPMLMAIGLNEDGEHSLLGASMISASLSEAWQRLMDQMRLAGLRSMKLAVSSAPNDLKMATLRAFPQAQWQRPAGVLHSRLMEKVPAPHRRTLRAYLSAMYTRNELLEAEIVAAKILSTLTRLGLWDAAIEFSASYPDTLTCFTLPKPMRRQVFDDKAFGALIDSFIQSATQSGQFRGCSVTRLRFDELIAESELISPLTTLPTGAVDPDKTIAESIADDMPPLLEITHTPMTATAAPVPVSALPDLLETTADPVVRSATSRFAPPVAKVAIESPPPAKSENKPTVDNAIARAPAPSAQMKSHAPTIAPVAKADARSNAVPAKPAVKPPPPQMQAKASAGTQTGSTTLEKLEKKIAAQAAITKAKIQTAVAQTKDTPAVEVPRVDKPLSKPESAKPSPALASAPLKMEPVSPTTAAPQTTATEAKPATATSPVAKSTSSQPAPQVADREVTLVSHAAPQPPAVTSLLDLGNAIDIDAGANISSRTARALDLPPLEDLQPFGTPWESESDDELADLEEPDFPDEPTLLPPAKEKISFETRLELEALENFVKASAIELEEEETPTAPVSAAEASTPHPNEILQEDIDNAIAVEIIEMPLPAGPVFPATSDPITIPVKTPRPLTKPAAKKPARSSRWRYVGASAAAIAINTVLFGLAVALLAPHGKAPLQASVSQFVNFIEAPAADAARDQNFISSQNNTSSGSGAETDATMGISETNRKLVAGGDAQPPALSMAAPELPVPTMKLTRIPTTSPTPVHTEHPEAQAPDAVVTQPRVTPTDTAGVPKAAPNLGAPAAGNGNGLSKGNGTGSGAPAGKTATAPAIEVNVAPQFRQPPAYPPKALMDGIEGEVTLEFSILEDGTVRDARVVEAVPSGVFDTAALSAIALWRYAPKTVDGQHVTRRARQSMLFTLRH